jgi:hypothetical protein
MILSSEHLQQLFTSNHILSIVTAVLSIPASPSIPPHNARKIYQLAMNVISIIVLPAELAATTKIRLTYSIQRALEGKLGREGKKGSISDGLKVRYYL